MLYTESQVFKHLVVRTDTLLADNGLLWDLRNVFSCKTVDILYLHFITLKLQQVLNNSYYKS